jgi:hypothetical protein
MWELAKERIRQEHWERSDADVRGELIRRTSVLGIRREHNWILYGVGTTACA